MAQGELPRGGPKLMVKRVLAFKRVWMSFGARNEVLKWP
jgi:hypothetical protein